MIPIKNFTPIGVDPELPPGYTRIKYLIFDGVQYLKNITLPYDFTAEFEVKPKEHTAYHNIYDNLSRNVMLWLRPDKKYELNINGISSITYSSKLTELKVVQTGTTHKLYVDGEYATQYTGRYVPEEGLSVSLFHRSINGQCFRGSVGRVSVYDSTGNPVLNLIPVLDPNNTSCMYDTVSGDTYYNEGSGKFSYYKMDGTTVFIWNIIPV